MSNSYVSYPGDGVTTLFTVTFPYLDKTHVHVYVGGVEVTYSWNSSTVISLTPAPSATVFIKRVTPQTPLVYFNDGSTLLGGDLNTETKQSLYIAQEATDAAASGMVIDPSDGNFSAASVRIKNVADPVNAQDAATKAYGDANWGGAASATATAAATAASSAASTASSAASSASTSAANAAASAATFKTSSTGSAIIPSGTTAQRDASPLSGYFRFNSQLSQFEGFNGTVWGSIGGGATGGGGDQVFELNSRIVTTSYSIPSGNSAISAGPITINSGVSVTIPSGSKWVIL